MPALWLLLTVAVAATASLPANFTVTVFQPASYTLTPTPASHMAALTAAIREASAAGSDLLVCPELYNAGYNYGIQLQAEPRDGPSYKVVAALALTYSINVLWTYAERNGTAVYDAAVLFTRQGVSVIDYRKVNLAAGESVLLTPGDQIAPVALVDGVRIGVLICFDIFLPEPARVLARQGMDLLLVPTANGYPPYVTNQLTQLIVPARALENNAVVVYNNWFQPNASFPEFFRFYGQSQISYLGGESLYAGPSDGAALETRRSSRGPSCCSICTNKVPEILTTWRSR